MSDRDTEIMLIERLRAQDASVLEILMERYSPRIYRVAFGITRSHGDAEEVVQDVFLTLFRKIDSFEGRAALGTWLYRVAANAALIKRRGTRAEVEVKLEDYLPMFKSDGHREGDRAMLLADWSGTPERELRRGKRGRSSSRAWRSCPITTERSSSCATSRSCRTRRWPRRSASRWPRSSRACTGPGWPCAKS